MVIGMPEFPYEHDGICEGCALGKNINKSFPKSNSRFEGTLDIIHSDICGPMTSLSLSGCLYYVLFIEQSALLSKGWSKGKVVVGSIHLMVKINQGYE